MDREVRVFTTHGGSDEADRAYYRSLSPQQRVDILLEIVARYREDQGEAADRFERVCGVTDLEALGELPKLTR